MPLRFYVDEDLPPEVVEAIRKRHHRAIHVASEAGLMGRDDDFHIVESRRRKAIFVTKNHHDFLGEFEMLRKHAGMVVFNPGAWTNTEDLVGGIDLMFAAFQLLRIGAKPPLRNDLWERRLVISSENIYLERADGYRFDVYPRPEKLEWRPTPRRRKKR